MNYVTQNFGRSTLTVSEIVSTMIKNGEQESDISKYTRNLEEWSQVIKLFRLIDNTCRLQAEVNLLKK